MAKIAKKKKNDNLYYAILALQTPEECMAFFEDLCTVSELRSMEQRYEVAKLPMGAKVEIDAVAVKK